MWGVDVAIAHLAFAYADTTCDDVHVETLITRTSAREGERLGYLDRQVRIYARQIAGVFPPVVVWVEQPSGLSRALQLTYATGVIQAALFEALEVPVWTIPSSAWKLRTVGRGNASKTQVQAWCDANRLPYGDEHQADAVAIAVSGRRMVQTGRWAA